MLPTPVEIKERLSKALDDKNDVDDATVVEMVTILEKYPITRSTLEETRIGKMVNDLRRKIKNEKLAKRVKQLVRSWKQLLDSTAPINGSPGMAHPSPAVSPALARTASSGRLVSPAQGRKGISPGLLVGRPITPNAGKMASPALASGRAKVPLTSAAAVSGRMASPAVSGRMASPAVSSKMASPAVSGKMASPALSGRVVSPAVPGRVASPLVSGRLASPAVSGRVPSPAVSGLAASRLASTPVQSPGLRTSTPVMGKRESGARKQKGTAGVDSSNGAGRLTPSSLYSENSQDRVLWEADNGGLDSDSESNCSSRTGQSRGAFPRNHSTSTIPSNNRNKDSGQDQKDVSKTDVANRKRTRDKLDSPPDSAPKKSRIESSSLSFSSYGQDKVINGCVSKSAKKSIPHVSSTRMLPSVSSPLLSHTTSDRLPFHHSYSEALLRQTSSDSHASERSMRDKSKVKTTEQLIEELQKKNSSSAANNIMTKLRSNQIEKEQDFTGSALPAGVKPRGKRGRPSKNSVVSPVPSTAGPDWTLIQAKNEHVAKFLNSSRLSSSVEEDSPFKGDVLPDPSARLGRSNCSASYSKDNFDGGFSTSRQDRSESATKDQSSMDAAIPSTSHTRRYAALSAEEMEAMLPPVDHDIDWDAVDFFELPEPSPVTEETVNRLHNQPVPGVNGVYDINQDWTTWQQCVSLPSFEGDLLHILPYVDLDK